MLINIIHELYIPNAVLLLLLIFTAISVDDGLLRTSTGCAGPSFSLTVYVEWSKLIVATSIQTYIFNNDFNTILC